MENIDWQYLLFKFDGRINRAKFWVGVASLWAIGIGFWILIAIAIAVGSSALSIIVGLLAIVYYVAVIWMGLAIAIKRWHDRGKSGWWILIGLIPIIGSIWVLVETGFLEGTKGANEYGPDPLATS